MRGLPQRLAERLRGRIRTAAGRAEPPTAAVIDSQAGRLVTWVATVLRLALTIVKRTDETAGFVPSHADGSLKDPLDG
ncbi:hypothetical protein [Actinoallomurus iriomotensis]|uniref:Uncharacterized protein n=1 Tax=Actinoallomurus iriomotensis TaxID=478107 RepID=A0A9W6W0M9_9ACTN|nr:hypothetical protein Airi02_104260 [Actinoallomurus iriomotensis]